ncbi:glycosyltransferase family 4 protein [Capillimicrobium parvum]|uniref:D-inositol-3-phosphate glycosyltransferase n=1 Tax=Capillimicrobium parvum TaxID=2884022 RepID=A0A9E6XV19_9ACTN|nr:glycosyltransferase family 4 protein [Capillimicrobium parvum]UGS34628.1 D-inositol-3-phosphate glycosyltransferase [Capillimicrobium parvum]
MRPTTVLLVCDWQVRYTVGLATGLVDQGAEISLMTRSHTGEFGAEPAGMRDFIFNELGPDVPQMRIGGRVRDPRAVVDVGRARRAARRLAPDVIHVQDSVVNDPRLFAAAAARRRRYAITVHDVDVHPGDPGMGVRKRRLFHALVRHAGLVFVHAEPLREQLMARHAPGGAVVVVPHGSGAPEMLPLPELPSLLLFGRMSAYKGLDTLLDAMPLIWRRAPETRLTVAGKGRIAPHPALADARVTVRNEYVPDDEVRGLFGAATCVILPYREASQSGVAALARRFGRGVVATAVGGLPDMARAGGALVVPPEDPAALAHAIGKVVHSPELAGRMSREAAEAARTSLAWPRVAELTLEAYERHLRPRHRSRGITSA